MTKISIIIPTLNESETISGLLEHILQNTSRSNISEIIIVDGGSTDRTNEIVSKYSELTLISSPKGRAKQMNMGAKNANGEILYFLHADSLPPKNFDIDIIDHIRNGKLAGCFRMKFDSKHWWLKLAGWFTQFNWKLCRGGDQSLFITSNLFNEIGKFDESFNIFEDYELISELYKRNQFTVIQKWLTTSARKYEFNGVWRLQYHFWMLYLKKMLGASPEELYTYYQHNIS